MANLDKNRDDRPSQDWAKLPSEGPYEPAIGTALITMVEPHEGHEVDYNRWYEDDHYISGAMAMPWIFAGRRWVATRDLQLLRYPESSPVAQPVTAGAYITVYWLIEGRYKEHFYWSVAINKRLNSEGHGFNEHRTHVYTNFQYYNGVEYRDATGPRDLHALNYPMRGLVLEVVDSVDGVAREDLDHWLEREYQPRLVGEGSPVMMSMRFEPIPMPGGGAATVENTAGLDRRVTLLHFLDQDPRECWDDWFVGNGEKIDEGGRGTMALAAPFIPTIPGTDIYADQLR